MLLSIPTVNSFGLFLNAVKMFMPSLPLFYNALQLWECPLNLKHTMDLHIQVIDFNNFVRNIVHVTGLPYNPQGQAIIEREHRTL
jgi:hypothetical protein